jgi:hypothetical protein
VLTIPAGSLTAVIPISIVNDATYEPAEDFLVTITGIDPGWALIADDEAIGTIFDDDVSISIADVSLLEGDAGVSTAVFTVTLSNPISATVTVDYQTADNTATAPGDYTAQGPATLTFTPGGPLFQTISVPVIGNTIPQANRTFFVNLSNLVNGQFSDNQAVGTIIDDDALPNLSITANVSQFEGNAGTTNFIFVVTLSTASGQVVTVNYTTVPGSATAGSDYTTTAGTLTFNPGQTSQTIVVPVIGNTVVEPDETFFVQLTGASGATIPAAPANQGIGTIQNDDTQPPDDQGGSNGDDDSDDDDDDSDDTPGPPPPSSGLVAASTIPPAVSVPLPTPPLPVQHLPETGLAGDTSAGSDRFSNSGLSLSGLAVGTLALGFLLAWAVYRRG